MGFLEWMKKGASLLKPKALALLRWAAPKAIHYGKKAIGEVLDRVPFGKEIKMVGNLVSQWEGTRNFINEIGKYARTLEHQLIGENIIFPDSMLAGQAYKEAIDNGMQFLKGGTSIKPTGNITVDRAARDGGTGSGAKQVEDTNMVDNGSLQYT